MDESNLGLVAAAFDRLLAKIWNSGCDAEVGRAVYDAKSDVLAILNGKWGDAETPAVNADGFEIDALYETDIACPFCHRAIEWEFDRLICDNCLVEWQTRAEVEADRNLWPPEQSDPDITPEAVAYRREFQSNDGVEL